MRIACQKLFEGRLLFTIFFLQKKMDGATLIIKDKDGSEKQVEFL